MTTSAALTFVFAYGSLICPKSRAITAPTVAQKTATPVLIRNVERIWAKTASMSGMTAMGVRFKDDAECVGVLLPVNDSELEAFDQREKGYDRVPIYLGDVETVPFLDDKYYDDEGHEIFLEGKEKRDIDADVKIWMYMQRELQPPNPDAPIAQSYVDTILRGCLSISEGFAEKFIADTKGWTSSEIDEDEENDNLSVEETDSSDSSVNSSSSDDEVFWVNDRHDPIYTRGDQEFMLKYGSKLDQLLKQHREEQFQYRSRRGRSAE